MVYIPESISLQVQTLKVQLKTNEESEEMQRKLDRYLWSTGNLYHTVITTALTYHLGCYQITQVWIENIYNTLQLPFPLCPSGPY